MMRRKNDTKIQTASRTTRMYEEGGSWYFNTREGTIVGPFRDELEAYTQLEIYIRLADSGMLPADDVAAARQARAKTAG